MRKPSNRSIICAAACIAFLVPASCKDSALLENVKIAVNKSVPVAGLTLSPTSASLIATQTCQLTASISPEDATDKTITWSSSDDGVAQISASGLTTAIAVGKVTITAKSGDQNASATCQVEVDRTLTTIVGVLGVSGNNAAHLYCPSGIAFDSAGDLYIADTLNNRIQKLDTSGNISTVAGTGTAGYSGDTGPAKNATLKSPNDVAFDSSGNLYIADTGNHCIRMVVAGGTISTVAGNGAYGSADNVSAASSACLNSPSGVYVHSTTIYVADTGNHAIRVFAVGGNITTVAGSLGNSGASTVSATSACLNNPCDIAVDGLGRIFIANTSNNCISMVSGTTISTIAGTKGTSGASGDGGSATAALMNQPNGVTLGSDGNIYIADSGNACIRVFSLGGIISTLAGQLGSLGSAGDGGAAKQAKLKNPIEVAIDSTGAIYFADQSNHAIRKAQ